MANLEKPYTDHFEHGRKFKISDNLAESIYSKLPTDIAYENLFAVNFLTYNGLEYRNDLLLINENDFFKIKKIIIVGSEFYFLCCKVNVISFDSFLNSLKVKITDESLEKLISLNSLKIKRSFQVQSIANESYVVVDTLEVKKLL